MNYTKFSLFFLIIFFTSLPIFSQGNIKGTATSNNKPLENVTIYLHPKNLSTSTNSYGEFIFSDIPDGSYTITSYYLGFETQSQNIEIRNNNLNLVFELVPDLINLKTVIITGSFDSRLNLQSSTSVSALTPKDIQGVFPRGTANLLQDVSGVFVDASAGEVFTRVYTRGVSASAEDDMGWYYVSLQEDGLPVSLAQHSYYSPDLFHRYDLTTKKVEAIRGGSAAITAANAPGGIFNFLSHGANHNLKGIVQTSAGIQGDSNPIYRIDTHIGGPLSNNWFFNIGGHYRHDEGARNSEFTFSKGGQLKFDLTKTHKNGYFKIYGKTLNDYTNRYTGVAAKNWNQPAAAFGQDFKNTSLLMPSFNAYIPDGRYLQQGATNRFNPAQGVHAKDLAAGIELSQNLGRHWTVKNNFKYSSKNANWQTSISNAFVSINNPLAYFISGANFPIGQVVFRDAEHGHEVARIDNSGILSGQPAQYLTDGRLPNDAVMGTSAWYKDVDADEFMNQLIIQKQWENHTFSSGLFLGFSDMKHFTQGSFGYTTYQPTPKMLRVTLENPSQPIIELSDANGVSNYGGLFYANTNANISQIAPFINDRFKINNKIYLDLGLRFEHIKHTGSKDRYAPNTLNGGVDGNPNTAYDNGILVPTGEKDFFNYLYNYVSYSAGINYSLTENTSVFGRFSSGNKAPELNYYFNNFSNVPINKKGEIQNIIQTEIGLKHATKNFSASGTLFWSTLKNIGVTNFEFDDSTNEVFYTPILFNTSRTIGLEWESSYKPFSFLRVLFHGVIQDPKATKWHEYDANGTVDPDDDIIYDYSGNTLAFNPKIMFHLGAEYDENKTSAFFKWQFMGQREGNVSNGFQLPSYSVFNTGLGYKITKSWSAQVIINNLFNSAGLANFFGANSFGASGSGATPEFVQANPDASFVVVPILPRSSMLKLNYTF
ncbi:TonB-dependent receptor [Tamlana fucoidanivorans]|uniref:TonB-dependent receptor n=1 Tax=Allotamlana fucoidanivorans TaxID=2583814 RepID=A0A5C4SJ48_9FLAO|nr:TonB-dependent receptor [Tamlana fucoidanivorans]TNJ43684.1 TonB-dependent receptor [Tamlana fucoidanivorans]